MKQPLERPEKLILVSFGHRGRHVWGLVPALKVGDKYKVATKSISPFLNRLNLYQGATYSS